MARARASTLLMRSRSRTVTKRGLADRKPMQPASVCMTCRAATSGLPLRMRSATLPRDMPSVRTNSEKISTGCVAGRFFDSVAARRKISGGSGATVQPAGSSCQMPDHSSSATASNDVPPEVPPRASSVARRLR